MGLVRVEDVVLWINHIQGDDALRQTLLQLPEDATVRLEVGGRPGVWRKMKNAATTRRPTNGLKPQGEMSEFWRELYERYKPVGGIVVGVTADVAGATETADDRRATGPVKLQEPRAEERRAALAELERLRHVGWSSRGAAYGRREDWYAEDGL